MGIVFVPALGVAHWVNIKSHLKDHPSNTVIRFHTSKANLFDRSAFSQLFVPTVLREVPDLSLPEALNLFDSERPDESYLGLIVLFRRYPNVLEVWDRLTFRFLLAPHSYPGEVGQLCAGNIPHKAVVEQDLRLIARDFRVVKLPGHLRAPVCEERLNLKERTDKGNFAIQPHHGSTVSASWPMHP